MQSLLSNYLKSFAAHPDFMSKMQMAFGNDFDVAKASELAESWLQGDFSNFPNIAVRRSGEINGAQGAFASGTNTIYLSQELVDQNRGNVDEITSVLLEEYGHYLDSQVNPIDSPGDEGAIFADLLQGKALSQGELAALKGEDDSAVVVLDGELRAIEQAETTTKKDTLNFSAKGFKDWSSNTFTTDEQFKKDLFDFNPSLPNGEFGFGPLTGEWALQTGIKGSIFATPGNLGEGSFSYPIDLFVSVPKSVKLGESFTIKTGVAQKSGNAAFDSDTKGAKLPNVGFKFTLEPLTAQIKNVTVKTPFGDFNNVVGANLSVPKIEAKIDYQSLIKGELSDPQQLGKLKFNVPEIEEIKPKSPTIVSDLSLPEIMASGTSNNVIEGELDLDRILAYSAPPVTLPLLALGNKITLGDKASRFGGSISYDILDLKLKAGVAVKQDFTFDPDKINVSMALEGQSPDTNTGTVGDGKEYTFTAPSEGCGLLKVKAQYELTGNMRNVIGILPKASLDFTALQAEATLKVGEFESPYPLNIGPVLSVQLPEGGNLTDVAFPLFGSPSTTELDKPLFPVLNTIKTSDLDRATEKDEKNPNGTKNLIVEVEYEIPYNLPVSVSDASIKEGDSGTKDLVFPVTLRDVPNEAVTLSYSSPKGSGSVTIAAGQTSGEIKIPVTGDETVEKDETFTLTVKDQNGKLFADCKDTDSAEATGTIIDDDSPDPKPEGRSSTTGEPHLVSFDGMYYDFQAAGEFTLLKSESGDLEVQVRQEPFRNEPVSINTAIATKIDGQRITIFRKPEQQTPNTPNQEVFINDQPTQIPDQSYLSVGQGRIYREGDTYTIVYPSGDQIDIDTQAGFKGINYLDINIYLTKEREGKITGLLGNYNNKLEDDIALRDGTIIQSSFSRDDLYGKYADSWRLKQEESLFHYEPGQSTNTFTNQKFPLNPITIEDLQAKDPQKFEEARQKVLDAGITDENLINAALLDFLLTGDESFIESAKNARTTNGALSFSPPFTANRDVATSVNNPIKIDILSNDSIPQGLPISLSAFDQKSVNGGTISVDDNATPDDRTDDQLIYTPPINFTGVDTFQYSVGDGNQPGIGTVTVQISNLKLDNIKQPSGFTFDGGTAGNFAGVSVNSIGDFNGDRIDDVIVGAFGADPNNSNAAGESYVVFGSPEGFTDKFDSSALNGNNGFILKGFETEGFAGGAVSSAGDINGDGLADIIIGAFGAAVDGKPNAGKASIIFGTQQAAPIVNLNDLNGQNGFAIKGSNDFDYLGLAVSSAGDINGDRLDDLLVAAPGPLDGTSGKTYVIYGRTGGFSPNLNLTEINGSNGFIINGINENSGMAVTAVGDMNGDRITDLAVANPGPSESFQGNAYIVYGRSGNFPVNLNFSDLVGGSYGSIINRNNGLAINSISGAGDLNGDGVGDLIIGASSGTLNGVNVGGESYVLFGQNGGYPSGFDLVNLNGTNGFVINGDGNSVSSVSSAGDINADGIDDVIIGVSQAQANGKNNAGQSYVIFGNKQGFPAKIDLLQLNGSNGFAIEGAEADDLTGTDVSGAGDINADGIDDLIIGSPGNLFNNAPGKSYVIFGSPGLGLGKPVVSPTNNSTLNNPLLGELTGSQSPLILPTNSGTTSLPLV